MTVTVDTPRRWIGKSIPKVEDRKFLLGRGNYVDDLSVQGMLHAATLRSPHAHARIVGIDAEPARRLPGVAAVVTCLEAMELCDPMPDFGPAPDRHAWRCMASRQGALRRGAGRRHRRDEPLRGRGRARPDRGGVRASRPGRQRDAGDGPVRSAGARGDGLERRDRLDAGLRGRRGGVRFRGSASSGTTCTGDAPVASRSRRSPPSRATTPRPG